MRWIAMTVTWMALFSTEVLAADTIKIKEAMWAQNCSPPGVDISEAFKQCNGRAQCSVKLNGFTLRKYHNNNDPCDHTLKTVYVTWTCGSMDRFKDRIGDSDLVLLACKKK